MKYIEYMQGAIALAKQAATLNEVPVGCVIVYENHIIASAHNQPIQAHDPTAHAEIVAMRQAAQYLKNYRLKDCTLYVTLEPCVMCVGAMIHARIGRLVYGASDPKTGAVDSVFSLLDHPQHNHRMTWEKGVLAADCGQLLIEFFAKRR
ncbi:MAG: tRNA-specific adenosine deaminase [Gammaproteobacteria bacterium RIFCSPHIGHO2_12_FULL_42_13]|nr:MAG: tRNA-specific adenosine deaminase [Gammaproteobacteria bacterium RIFCSPHIGHO2_12_FULL_42_13]